jgi:valyl-tRNA synthetase
MNEFPKSYSPAEAEQKWYDFWSEKGYFMPEANPKGDPYTIVIPPPNVTGSLHMGHALNATLQDSLIRWKRMKGFKTLWLPGMDHAGIATQNVVERQLAAEGTDRHALGRDKFIERVWQWKEQSGGTIINQLKKTGASCDWSRERFTLDDGLSKAVREVFVRLHEEGLMYRDSRLINWCPRCNTALSDLEVEHEELDGTLTYMKYPFDDGSGHVEVATTRPETMLGDTAVAVNPEDERYKDMIGKLIKLPLTNRKIPLVADIEVDQEFGTGAVKVTPAHDFNDEAIAKRQTPQLEFINVIGEDGKMTEHAGGTYEGLDRYEARGKVVKDLDALGLLVKEETHKHAVGHCYRCKTTIEPLGKPQWFVKIAPLAKPAIKAVRDGDIKIVPKSWENSYFAWMENIRDWCVSRQIWWGHRIPAWYCDDCGETIVKREDPTECTSCGGSVTRDPDVLDTWFSSALWPFSTLGWPDKTVDLKAHYPTNVLITAHDILFFWVARMIMMGLKFMGEVPFKDVYIHALVRDSEGQKMSKSKGNVVDPLTISNKFGTDAFRFTLAAFAAQGRDVKFSEERVEGYRHFINKLWNATRYILMGGVTDPSSTTATSSTSFTPYKELKARIEQDNPDSPNRSLASRWILSRLDATAKDVNKAFDEYRFNDAASAIYQFTWREFCDWYIEMTKTGTTEEMRDTLLYCLENILRLLHPIMPFVTEDLWHRLPIEHSRESLMVSSFPEGARPDSEAEETMAIIMDSINGIRNIRGEINVPPAEILKTHIKTTNADVARRIKANVAYIEKIARAELPEIGPDLQKPEGAYTSVKDKVEVYVILAGLDVSAERERLKKEMKKLETDLKRTENKLDNRDFIERAPAAVIEKEKARQIEMNAKLAKIEESLKQLEAAG